MQSTSIVVQVSRLKCQVSSVFSAISSEHLSINTPDTCIRTRLQDYGCGAHRLPLPPLCPVGLLCLFRAVVAGEAIAMGLSDATGATGAALIIGETEAALLTTGTTDTALTAVALPATIRTVRTVFADSEEMTGAAVTAEVTAAAFAATARVETRAEAPAAGIVD